MAFEDALAPRAPSPLMRNPHGQSLYLSHVTMITCIPASACDQPRPPERLINAGLVQIQEQPLSLANGTAAQMLPPRSRAVFLLTHSCLP